MKVNFSSIENDFCEHNKDILLGLSDEQLGMVAREIINADDKHDSWMHACHCDGVIPINGETKSEAALKAVLKSLGIKSLDVDSICSRI